MTTDLTIEYGKKLLPHLVHAAKTRRTYTYSEMGAKIGAHHRAIRYGLGYIRDEICMKQGLPLLTCIVVNSDTGLPGSEWLPEGTSHLSEAEYVAAFEDFRDQVFNHKGWDALLQELDIAPVNPTIEDLDERGRVYAEILERTGGGGEGEDHLKLKEYIAAHPEIIGLEKDSAPQMEYFFVAGDRADIVFGTGPDSWAITEIKNGDPAELVKGVYQAIKYRALLQAEKGHGAPVQVDAIVVAYQIPAEITFFAAKFGIRCKIIHRQQIQG